MGSQHRQSRDHHRSQQSGGYLMTAVAYLLVLVGAELSHDAGEAERQVEEENQLLRALGGEAVGPWEFHFRTLDDAKLAAHHFRQAGFKFNDIQITTIDHATGRELPS